MPPLGHPFSKHSNKKWGERGHLQAQKPPSRLPDRRLSEGYGISEKVPILMNLSGRRVLLGPQRCGRRVLLGPQRCGRGVLLGSQGRRGCVLVRPNGCHV